MSKFKEVLEGAKSLVEGMKVTLGHAVKPVVTVQYPHTEAPISPVQRNAIVLINKEEVGGESHNCIACLQCEKICPSHCISITGTRTEGLAFKRPDKFDMNFALCSECGLCLYVCPTETLGWSKTYDHASYSRDFVHDLLGPHKAKEEATVAHLKEVEAKKKAEKEAQRAAAAAAKPPAPPAPAPPAAAAAAPSTTPAAAPVPPPPAPPAAATPAEPKPADVKPPEPPQA